MESNNPDWDQIVALTTNLSQSTSKFIKSSNRLELIQFNLIEGNKIAAFWAAEHLIEEDKIIIFPTLLDLAICTSAYAKRSQDVILGISPQWLIDNIEEASKPILDIGYDFEYWQLLTLCSKISLNLTHRIASIAIKNEDKNIREAGEYFMWAP